MRYQTPWPGVRLPINWRWSLLDSPWALYKCLIEVRYTSWELWCTPPWSGVFTTLSDNNYSEILVVLSLYSKYTKLTPWSDCLPPVPSLNNGKGPSITSARSRAVIATAQSGGRRREIVQCHITKLLWIVCTQSWVVNILNPGFICMQLGKHAHRGTNSHAPTALLDAVWYRTLPLCTVRTACFPSSEV